MNSNKKINTNFRQTNAYKFDNIGYAIGGLFTIEAFMALVIGLMVLLGILLCVNHVTSTVKEHVVATVIDRSYSPPYDTEDPIYTTDSKGNQVLVGFNHTHHPEEWHVTWGYQGLSYTASTYSNWGGWAMGAKREMVIRVGGIFKSEYLWNE